MIEAFDPQRRGLVAAPAVPARGWVHVTAPDDAERAALAAAGLDGDLLRHALDVHEVARVEHDDDGRTLIILRVPGAREAGSRSTTLGVVLRGELCATMTATPLPVVAAAAARLPVTERPAQVLAHIVLTVAETLLARVDEIDAAVDELERALQTSQRNQEVLALLDRQKELVYLERALVADQLVIERLLTDPRGTFDGADKDVLAGALVELRQAIQMTAISAEILASMMDAFASIISINLNRVMKVLAGLALIAAIPAVVATLWGMNVPVPGAGHPWAFVILAAIALILAVAVGLVFVRRRWL